MAPHAQLAHAAETLFSDLDLGDKRRDRRFHYSVQCIANQPGPSLPKIFANATEYNAFLDLYDAPEVTHENILKAHRVSVLEGMKQRTDTLLIIHDATTLDFSGHHSLEDELGPIGNGGGIGYLAHQTLAVDPSNRTVLGLLNQILHVREVIPKKEKAKDKRERLSRESRLWTRGVEDVGPVPAHCHWIDVADRGADVFEFLQYLSDRQRRFIIRSTHNRALGTGPTDEKAEQLLKDFVREKPAVTELELEIPAREKQKGKKTKAPNEEMTETPKKKKRKRKTEESPNGPTSIEKVQLAIASAAVHVRPPHVRRGEYRNESVPVNVVRVWELNPPEHVKEPLEWILLTTEPVETAEQLRQVVQWYSCRTQIEEFHKVQKSGVSVEGCQVQSAKKMQALIVTLSVVAVGLMNLRLAARDPELAARPATDMVPRLWILVIKALLRSRKREWTIGEFWIGLAKCGGYMKNPKKHPPGWITIWRGWNKLQIGVACNQCSDNPDLSEN